MKERIEVGDKVNVFFDRTECIFDAEVLSMPQDTGDCWRLREKSGALTYVQQFDKIELIESLS